jgi:hypothetical protein
LSDVCWTLRQIGHVMRSATSVPTLVAT